jgi:1-acyl-sn-glycerol-3-phosphate acyltransferase
MTGKHPTWYAFVRFAFKYVYFATHGGIRSAGEDNIPISGPVLLAPLHISHLDPPAVACGMQRRIRFMAKQELFKNPLFGFIIASIGAYPVKRGETDTEAIRKTISLLEEGEIVLIFPEGTRGDGESIQEMSRGIAMLAKRTKVPVVPVGVIGTNVVMPKGSLKGHKHMVTLAYGKPFTYAEVATSENDKVNRELFLSSLQSRIVELCEANGKTLRISPSHSDSEVSGLPER